MRTFDTIHGAMAEVSRDIIEMGVRADDDIEMLEYSFIIPAWPEQEDLVNTTWGIPMAYNQMKSEIAQLVGDGKMFEGAVEHILGNKAEEGCVPDWWELHKDQLQVQIAMNHLDKLMVRVTVKGSTDTYTELGYRIALSHFISRYIYSQLSASPKQVAPIDAQPTEINLKILRAKVSEVDDLKIAQGNLL